MWFIVLKSLRSPCILSCKPVFFIFLTFHFSHCIWTCQRDQINLVDIPPSLYLDLPNPALVDICYAIMHGSFFGVAFTCFLLVVKLTLTWPNVTIPKRQPHGNKMQFWTTFWHSVHLSR